MTQSAGLSLLFYCLLFKLKQTPWLGMVFPFFLIFSLYSLLTVTFTQACLTLLFAVAAAISCRASLNDWPVLTRRGLACLLLWALLWRWKFGLICLVFFVPLAIVQFSQLRKYFRLLAMVLGLLAVDRFIHHQWASPEWYQYMEFYETRAKLFDMPAGRAGENLELALQSAGWSAEDYQLIRESWMLYDERLTNQASMTRFIEAVGNHGGASVIEQIEGNLRNIFAAFVCLSPDQSGDNDFRNPVLGGGSVVATQVDCLAMSVRAGLIPGLFSISATNPGSDLSLWLYPSQLMDRIRIIGK